MTIFLTTQYLEEADALAERVGFIARGRLVAEGSPDELKRSIGQDLIVAEMQTDVSGEIVGDLEAAMQELSGIASVGAISVEDAKLIFSTSDGPGH